MAYQMTVEDAGGYLHVTVVGDNTPDTVRDYLADVHRECTSRGCSSVLIEENLTGPGLAVLDIFEVVAGASGRTWPQVRRIAYVDVNPDHHQANVRFAETVAVNRGVNVRVFRSVGDAEAWIQRPPTFD